MKTPSNKSKARRRPSENEASPRRSSASPPKAPAPAIHQRRLRLLPAAVVVYLCCFGLSFLYIPFLAHRVHGPATLTAFTILPPAVSLAAGIWVTYLATGLDVPALASVLLTVVFAASWLGMTVLAPGKWLSAHPIWGDFYMAASYLSLALASSFLGKLIALAFRDRNLVAAGALVGAVVDYWGVNFGTTRYIVHHYSAIHQKVSVHAPHLGPVTPLIGPGDYVFIGIMLALVHRFDLRPALTAVVMWLVLVLSIVGVIEWNWSVPAILPMAAAVIVPNVTEFKLRRDELFALLYVALILGVGAFAWWWTQQSHAGTRSPVPAARAPSRAAPSAARRTR